MKMYILTLLIASLTTCNAQRTIETIKFTTGSRGWNNSVIINKDSVFVNNVRRMQPASTTIKNVKTSKKNWESLLVLLKKIDVEKIAELSHKSKGSEVDAAAISRITIVADKKEYSHSFDNYSPNESLEKLLTEIKRINDEILKDK